MESVLYTRIKELCENRGISMTKLSEDLGIAASLIRKWKTTTSPSVDKVKMIAEYFGVSADYLIGLSDIQDSAEKLVGDEDFVSLQRAKSRMSPPGQGTYDGYAAPWIPRGFQGRRAISPVYRTHDLI